ncbi:hypothetical protein [Mycobacterium sp. PSTR-4-N]|uniref:hypothetical protein n=1 Tax=Mycobacterium sp. PSTR-4-N TaxID=2917745 RepID=UPI001F151FF7|nr:hypothetical protein [Mycobacterium sp. PSTR-4-N]MCG7597838.1 hypothetical protein [Mycobacterium sp. PSTR-4-N]
MRLRRRLFQPQVHTTAEVRRPITVTLAGLEFDLTTHDALRLVAELTYAINEVTEGEPS